jgi:hypothetical protein
VIIHANKPDIIAIMRSLLTKGAMRANDFSELTHTDTGIEEMFPAQAEAARLHRLLSSNPPRFPCLMASLGHSSALGTPY